MQKNSINANLPIAEPEFLKKEVKQAIYINMWRAAMDEGDSAFSRELEQGFKSTFNIELDRDIAHAPAFNFGLFGPGGHGKTSTLRSAAQEVCDEMNLKLVKESGLSLDYVPGERDFIYGNINLGGSYSTSEFAIPQAVKTGDAEKEDFMNRLGHRIFSLSRRAKGCILTFEDVSNTQPNLIGPLLEITESNALGSNRLSSATTIAMTGNIAGDGSVGTLDKLGAPLHSRIKNYWTEDSPESWKERFTKKVLEGRFSDEAKGFLLAMPAMIERAEGHFISEGRFMNEASKGAGSVVNPRSLDNFGERSLVLAAKNHRAGMYGDSTTLNNILEKEAESALGTSHSSFIATFLESYLNKSQRLAADIVSADLTAEEPIDKTGMTPSIKRAIEEVESEVGANRASSEAESPDAMSFSYQYGKAISNEFAIRSLTALRKDTPDLDTVKDIAKKFSFAVKPLSPIQRSNALEGMVDSLISVLPEQYVDFSSDATQDRKVLKREIVVPIVEGMKESGNEAILTKETAAILGSQFLDKDSRDDLVNSATTDDLFMEQ